MTDLAIVGAGLAGLEAARTARRRGLDAVVLEARDRVGGRLLNAEVPGGATVELGGQWIGPGQPRVAALAAELGLETFPTWTRGENLLALGGRRVRYTGTIPKLNPAILADIGITQWRLERMARTVPADAPWRARRAAEWDGQTLWSWLRRNTVTTTARELFGLAARTVWGTTAEELSLLQVLFYVNAAGSFNALLDTEGGAQQDRLVGGSVLLAERMAAELDGAVELGAPVRRIVWSDEGVELGTDARTVTARRAVVAIPPFLAGRIEYDPPLPALRDQLTQRMPTGAIVKCVCAYDAPFWRDDGLSGEAVTDAGPVTLTFDNSPPEGRPGLLLGFVGGPEARAFAALTPDERRRAVIDSFVALFGTRAAEPLDYLEQDWSAEEWTRGGPTSLFTTGGWTAYGPALREPVGPIHWSGTETATSWSGYMEGALQAGERAALEAAAAVQAAAEPVKQPG